MVVLPEQTLETAGETTERRRKDVSALAIPHPACGARAVVTVSAGIAKLDRSDGGDFEAVLKRADVGLYRAKALGGNRVDMGLADRPGAEKVAGPAPLP